MVLSMLLGSIGLEEFYLPDFILRHQMRIAYFRDEVVYFLPSNALLMN